MKRYGVWKYCLVISILFLGLVYSLPNIYSPNPAVQISYNNSSQNADETLNTHNTHASPPHSRDHDEPPC